MGRDYRNILAYQKSDDLAVLIYGVTRSFPKEELYGLTSQVRRAAVSVPANIAEGSARRYLKEFLHYLYTSKSSLAETEYYVHLARRLKYIDEQITEKLSPLVSESARILHGLIDSVEEQIKKGEVYNHSSQRARSPKLVAKD